MSDKVKLIIEIPKGIMEYIKNNGCLAVGYIDEVAKAFQNGTPLDDVKAEIEKLGEGITSYDHDNPWVYKSEVLMILDNIGSEDKPSEM